MTVNELIKELKKLSAKARKLKVKVDDRYCGIYEITSYSYRPVYDGKTVNSDKSYIELF